MSYENLFHGGNNRAGVEVPNHTQWKIRAESLLDDRNIFQVTAEKKFPLGALAESRDGRRWRYCENGGVALTLGLINQHSAGIAGWQDEAQTNNPSLPTAGDKIVTVTLTTTATAGDLIDGYLTVEDGTGEGHLYLIKDNKTGVANATTGFDVVVEIADTGGIRTAYVAGSELTVTKAKNKEVVVEAGTGQMVGVNHVAVPADNFFWAQTRGYCPVQSATTIGVIGNAVMPASGSVVILGNAATDVIAGTVIRAAANGETAIIDLSIE